MNQLAFEFSVPLATRQRFLDPARLPLITKQWSARFSLHFRRPFQITFNDNTSTMISSRICEGVLRIRLHYMFIDADEAVLAVLANYLKGRRRGNQLLDRFIQRNLNRVTPKRRRKPELYDSTGQRFDLSKIRNALNRAYFDVPVKVPVVWGTWNQAGSYRSIRLGSYSFEDHLIRIHPALDLDFVPAYVVVGVVYHEMLHHAVGFRDKSGRRLVHTRDFREREAIFVHHRRAEAWEKEQLGRLLRRSRNRKQGQKRQWGRGW